MAKSEIAPSPAPPRRNRQRREEVADDIKQLILRERLGPGDPLPTETELCEAVGASRSSVREAVKQLAALDIVEVRHGHGTYVGSMSLGPLVESLAFRGLLSRSDDHKVISELVDVRQTLEQGFAAQIVAGLDTESRAELLEIATAMRESANHGESYIELDRAFHLHLMEPLDNDLLTQLTGAFWDVHAIVAPSLDPSPEGLRQTAEVHIEIAEAAIAGDVEAMKDAIERHYQPIRTAIEHSRTHT